MRGKLCAPCPYDQALLVIVSTVGEGNNCGTRIIAPSELFWMNSKYFASHSDITFRFWVN